MRLRLDLLPALARSLQPGVHLLELLAPDIREALVGLAVEGLVRAEEGPMQRRNMFSMKRRKKA